MPLDVSILLFGEFQARIGERAISGDDFQRRSAVELVALLALSEQYRLPKEQIVDALWPDLSLDAGANQLNKASTYARNAFGERAAIVLKNGVVSLFPTATLTVDYHRLLNVDLQDQQAIDEVLTEHPGQLLPDWPYTDWTAEPRRAAHRFRLDLLRQRSRWDEILLLEPLDEGAHMALMAAALERGNRDDVMRRFERLEQLLEEELGIGPSTAAKAIRDEAMQGSSGSADSVAVSGLRSFISVGLEETTDSGERSTKTMPDVIKAHDGMIEGIVERLGGTICAEDKHRFLAMFTSASNAISAAVECQRSTQGQAWPDGDRPGIKIALDLGEAERRDGVWSGPVLTRLDQMTAAAWADQIICSTTIAEMAAFHGHDDVRSADVGIHRLPGVAPTRLHRLIAEGITDRQTPLRAARSGGRAQIVDQGQLFGRENEINELLDQLAAGRLVSIVGPGGCGKTHLAKHLAAQIHPTLTGGAWMCELSAVTDGAAIGQVILSSLGGHLHSDATIIESIARTVGESEVLLVIDNCEHLGDAVRVVCEELLSLTPTLRLLATSRQPVDLPEERVFALGQLTRSAAIELFVAQAKRTGAAIEPDSAVIDRICERLDDLPLALQLAAARTAALDLETIESLLEDRFAYLTTKHQSGPAHHQTLHAAISWSFDALTPETKDVLAALSVFAGRFKLQTATSVCAEHGEEHRFVERFEELVRRSLIVRPDRNGSYRLLASIKLFAEQTLPISQEPAVRHLEFFSARAQQSRDLMNTALQTAFARFDEDWDDLRQALGNAGELGRPAEAERIIAGCATFSILTQATELSEWCDAYLNENDGLSDEREPRTRAEALLGWSYWLAARGKTVQAKTLGDAALKLVPGSAIAQWVLGFVDYSAGASDHGRSWFSAAGDGTHPDEAISQVGGVAQLVVLDAIAGNDVSPLLQRLELAAADGGVYQQACYLLARAMHLTMTDPAAALTAFDECTSLAERHDLLVISATARSARAFTLLLSRPLSEAYEGLRSTMEWSSNRGMWSWTIGDFPTAAGALELGGEPRVATLLLSARSASRFDVGIGSQLVDLQIEGLRAAHPADFETWWQQGKQLSPSGATRLAITSLDDLLGAK